MGSGSHATGAREREVHIRTLLQQTPVPLDELRQLALSPGGGFVSNELRQVIWPKLLGLNRFEAGGSYSYRQYVRRNQWSEQISRDVDRSLWHYQLPPTKKRKRGNRRRLLEDMINAMMVKRPELHYYQGYHDILSVLVLVLTDSEELCFAVAERLTLGFLGDCMLRPDFRSLTLLLELLGPLVTAFDPDVGRVLEEAGVHAYVSLPWVITWWSHDSRDLGRCARMYDAFLAAPPVFPLYVAAAMIARARTELLAMGPEERDFASVHTFLARLAAREDLPVEALIVDAMRMLRKRPPAALVRASGSPALVEAVRRGEIHALAEPPDWHRSKWADPDWLLLERRNKHEGRSLRSKQSRARRRRAKQAGARVPTACGDLARPRKGAGPGEGARALGRVLLGFAAVGVATVAVRWLGAEELLPLRLLNLTPP